MSVSDPYVLPEGLPAPEDDGAADHLTGPTLPDLVLPSVVTERDTRWRHHVPV